MAEVTQLELDSISQTPSWHPYCLETLPPRCLFKNLMMCFCRNITLIPSKRTPCRGHRVSKGSRADTQGRKGCVLAGACFPESLTPEKHFHNKGKFSSPRRAGRVASVCLWCDPHLMLIWVRGNLIRANTKHNSENKTTNSKVVFLRM